ncbi:type II secretion system F family protein [Verrucomicrobiota bacterium]
MIPYLPMKASEKQLQLALFWKRFSRLTRGRVPILRAMKVIIEEETDGSFKKTLSSLLEDIEHGTALSEALTKHPSVFSSFVTELIRSAEKSGAWDEILQEIIEGMEDGTF